MRRILTAAERLIVAADFRPLDGLQPPIDQQGPHLRWWVRNQVLALADSLKGTGVCLKVNSALRACGYDLIDEIHARGLRVFADLKLIDIGETLSTDGVYLREAKPELLTVMCVSGVGAMRSLKIKLPDTEVLGVTVLTSLKNEDTKAMFVCSAEEAVMRLTRIAAGMTDAKIDGFVSAGTEAAMLRGEFGELFTLNTPAIRPKWAAVKGDDQNKKRSMTAAEAILAGADRIVVGRPIVQAENPYDAVMRTIEEIASAIS
ncbi:MAG: orotidine-5'-phosphate decarboxylase [Candidatus Paceibacterota bacterium]|jgi:orotidine-5'-phosphate decarboxylase